MTDLRKAAEMALEALEYENDFHKHRKESPYGSTTDTITALRAALAQPDEKEKFCDRNCVWTDHHPGCALAQPELKTVSPEQDLQLVSNLLKEYGLSVLETLAAFKAQTEQEPFGWLYESRAGVRVFHLVADDKRSMHVDFETAQMYPEAHTMTALYTQPPLRKPLTDAEIDEIAEDGMNGYDRFTFTSAIERAHGIRGEYEAN